MVHERPAWAPDDVDIETPSTARMYDFYLDGSHNFAADRVLAQEALRAYPNGRDYARANRAFLSRAVSALVALGIDQFLDLGSGIPTAENVHQVAQALDPQARIVYVDSDAVAHAHGTALLADVPRVCFVRQDLREPAAVLCDPAVRASLDFDRPIAVLMFSVLPFVPDEDDPGAVVAAYRDATVSGSYLALSHGTGDYSPAQAGDLRRVYTRASHTMTPRSRDEILKLMQGYDLLEPGLTDAIRWRPDPQAPADPYGGDAARYSLYGVVGRKP